MVDENLEKTVGTCNHQLTNFLDLYETNPNEALLKYEGKQEEMFRSLQSCKVCQDTNGERFIILDCGVSPNHQHGALVHWFGRALEE